MNTIQSLRIEKWMAPVWNGDRVWEESVCFFEDAEGNIRGGNLLYERFKITSVINYDASVVYEEHIDYEITDKGICRTEHSRIPVLKRQDYVSPYEGIPQIEWLCLPGKEYFVHIKPDIHEYQILVTYEVDAAHDEWGWAGIIPAAQGMGLPETYGRLEHNESLHIVYYGDSITAGWEASGADETAIDMYTLEPIRIHFERYPKMPVWARLVTEQLQSMFPNAKVTGDNLSAGGSTAKWGLDHVNELFDRVETPDLVFLGFSMNCMWDPAETFIEYIDGIVSEIRKRNPLCEFVVYPAMVANPEMEAYRHDNLLMYERALTGYAARREGIVCAPVHSMFREVMARGKEYYEISGNAVNHPNDFAIRLYAQVIWETICR